MGLAAYRSCSFTEKRDVLRTFWSRRADGTDRVVQAAREYGPYAVAMVAVITVELIAIATVLLVAGSAWGWITVLASALSALSTWWADVCRRASKAWPSRP